MADMLTKKFSPILTVSLPDIILFGKNKITN